MDDDVELTTENNNFYISTFPSPSSLSLTFLDMN